MTPGKIVTRAQRTVERALSSCIAVTAFALQKLERIAEHVTTTAGLVHSIQVVVMGHVAQVKIV